MVELLQVLARRLRPLLPLSVAVGVAGIACFVWSALATEGETYLIAGLLAALWSAWLFTLLTGFQNVPPLPQEQQPITVRLRLRLARAGYTTMAWLLLGSALAGGFITFRLTLLALG